jgi:hypothetical protein
MGSLVRYDPTPIIFLSNTGLVAEELLIDFRELLGEHSGENMAEAVWETLVMYGIERRVGITRDSSKPIC